MHAYPRIKVLIAFTLCPFFVSALLFTVLFFSTSDNKSIIELVLRTLSAFIFFGFFGLLVYGIPALMAAIFYMRIKPYKNIKGILTVTTTGMLAAFLWSVFLNIAFLEKGANIQILLVFTAYGAISSFVMGLVILPRKKYPGDTPRAEMD